MAVRLFLISTLAYFSLSLFPLSAAQAKYYLNSACTLVANSAKGTVIGEGKITEKFPLASISKVVTSLWALETLGPDYRFTTKLHFTKVSQNSYDLHIEGSRDPIFGRNSSYFIISELNQNRFGIRNIEKLTFDENFIIDWFSEEHPRIAGSTPFYGTQEEQIAAVLETLKERFLTPVSMIDYRDLQRKAARLNLTLEPRPSISVRKVEFKAKKTYSSSSSTVTLLYQSAPLKNILKRMNNQSNNYIADNLFWNLGGVVSFNNYVTSKLKLPAGDLEFYLGSGNNADYIFNSNHPIYNKASCETMVKVLLRMDHMLKNYGYNLSDIMAVSGIDRASTVGGYNGNFQDSMIAKTGSVNKAKTLAGTISTKSGTIFFAVLMHTDSRADWAAANAAIRSKVNDLITKSGGPERLKYEEVVTLPFDSNSRLKLQMQNRLN